MSLLILFLAFFQAPDRGVALRDGCSSEDAQIGVVAASDRVEVRGAIAGDEGTCYHLEVTHQDKTVSGYVLGETLPAVAEFVRQTQESSRRELEAIARQAEIEREAARAPAASAKASARPQPSAEPEIFANFSGRDLKGKTISLAGLPGRLIVVQFWAPHGSSKQELLSLLSLYNRYKGRGLSIVGLGMGIGEKHLSEALDDITLPFPQIADPGLGRRYKVDARVGKTFVLDQSRRVIASGSAADAMRAVNQWFSKPDSPAVAAR